MSAYIEGTITLDDGSTSQFSIGSNSWSQWGAPTERLGKTVDIIEAMAEGLRERGEGFYGEEEDDAIYSYGEHELEQSDDHQD